MADDALRGALRGAKALARAGLRIERPDRLPRSLLALVAAGPTLAGTIAASAARYPLAAAVIDGDGALSYLQLWRGASEIARELRKRGVGEGDVVGVLERNGRTFALAMVAAADVGADIVYLNTGFAGPQLADVVASEGIGVVLHGDEFADVVADSGVSLALGGSEMDAIRRRRSLMLFTPSRHVGRQIILTSGTTGRPKGAARGGSGGRLAAVGGLTAILDCVPVSARDTVVVPAPWFHAWGLANLAIMLGLSCTVVTEERFDPASTLAAVERHRAAGLVVVPVMLRRMLDAAAEGGERVDTSTLRYIAASGSAIGAPLVRRLLQRFGPILYNIYGSTEVSLATIAAPDDLAAEPSTAGRPVPGSTVRILDHLGLEVPAGTIGRVFVGNATRFEGYTGGGSKESIGGLLSTGDLGRFDSAGRLFIEGREDDMIVSGGENVFPGEVEDLLAAHPGVAEVAVVGVPDDAFGQRLVAYVVRRPRARVTAEQLRRSVAAALARHKVPRDILFVDALPRTTTGKVLRRVLAANADVPAGDV
jgi:fatty-acyl-CoA synthase